MNDEKKIVDTPRPRALSEKRAKIFIAILSGIIVALGGIYFLIRALHVQKTEQNLIDIAQDRSDQINDYVSLYREQGELRVAQPFTTEILEKVADVTPQQLQSGELKTFFDKFGLSLEEFSTLTLYINSILIRPDGLVVFSDFLPEYVGKNVTQEPYKNYAMGKSFMRASMSLAPDISSFNYDPIFKQALLVVSLPVQRNGKLMGVLVQRVSREPIFEMMDNYVGLGKTGDTILGEASKDGILFLSRTRADRNDPLKKFVPYFQAYGFGFPLAYGSSGYKDSGVVQDHNKSRVVAAWQYIPKVDWGIVAKINLEEISANLFTWRLLGYALSLLLLMIIVFIAYRSLLLQALYRWFVHAIRTPALRRRLSLILLISAACLAAGILYSYYASIRTKIDETRTMTAHKVSSAIGNIENILAALETVGQELGSDLGSGRLQKADLIARMKKDIQENPAIFGVTVAYAAYAFDPTMERYAPYVTKKNGDFLVERLDEGVDYLSQPITKDARDSGAWYAQAVKEKSIFWFDPYQESRAERKFLGVYSLPFYDPLDTEKNNPLGVVSVVFHLQPIIDVVAKLNVGETGYGFLASHAGNFIYFPIKEYENKEKNIVNFARYKGSLRLQALWKKAQEGKKGFGTFTDHENEAETHVYFEPVPGPGWVLMTLINETEVRELSAQTQRRYFIWLMIAFFVIMLALMWFFMDYTWVVRYHVLLITGMLIILLSGMYYSIRISPVDSIADTLAIPSQVHLNQFLNERNLFAQHVVEAAPIQVVVGLLLYAVTFPAVNELDVSGYCWLKYPKDIDKSLIKEPQFPQAIDPVGLKKSYEEIEGDQLVIGWQFDARLAQKFNFDTYPLDWPIITVDLEHPDMSENILLIPDFADYYYVQPEHRPGVYKYLTIPGFTLKKAFFSYQEETGDTNFGLQSYANTANRFFITYNLVLQRHLLYEFIVFLLPLFVVFLFLFTLSWVSEKEWLPIMQMSGYTGLLFATILLHRTLRERYAGVSVLYMEYLFFMIYLTIVPLVLYILLKTYSKEQRGVVFEFFKIYRSYYWSIQITILTIITLFVFYSV